MKKITLLLILITISIIGIAVGVSKDITRISQDTVSAAPWQSSEIINDPVGTIDGARNPELIPDDVAYSLLFEFLAGRQSESERNSIRYYFKQTALNGVNFNALLAVADEFRQRVNVVDNQAQQLRGHNSPHPSPEIMAQLHAQKQAILAEIMASLPSRLGIDGTEKIRQHINERVKRRVKIVPGPMMPPGNRGM